MQTKDIVILVYTYTLYKMCPVFPCVWNVLLLLFGFYCYISVRWLYENNDKEVTFFTNLIKTSYLLYN